MFLMAWAAAARSKTIFKFTDRVGRVATTQIWTGGGETDPEGGGPAALRTALLAVTDLAIKSLQLLKYAKNDAPAAADTDAFDRPTDKLEVTAITAEGIPVTMKLPSVLQAFYQNDGVTPLATGVAADLLATILTNCRSADGDALVTIKRARRMVPRGLKTWTKAA